MIGAVCACCSRVRPRQKNRVSAVFNVKPWAGLRPWLVRLPIPMKVVADDEVQAVFFPAGEPAASTALGATFMWWVALLDRDTYHTALENLAGLRQTDYCRGAEQRSKCPRYGDPTDHTSP